MDSQPEIRLEIEQLPERFSQSFSKELVGVFQSYEKSHAVNLSKYENLTQIVIYSMHSFIN
jgi:hypothetical protein